jgi:hypothetical protein
LLRVRISELPVLSSLATRCRVSRVPSTHAHSAQTPRPILSKRSRSTSGPGVGHPAWRRSCVARSRQVDDGPIEPCRRRELLREEAVPDNFRKRQHISHLNVGSPGSTPIPPAVYGSLSGSRTASDRSCTRASLRGGVVRLRNNDGDGAPGFSAARTPPPGRVFPGRPTAASEHECGEPRTVEVYQVDGRATAPLLRDEREECNMARGFVHTVPAGGLLA